MAGNPENPMLQCPRRTDVKFDRMLDNLADVEVGSTPVGGGVAGVRRRVDRLERRLDFVDPH